MVGLRALVSDRLLLVEGKEDREVIDALLAHRGIAGVQVEATGGKDGLRDDLLAWTRVRGFDQVSWLGIVQDGDQDPAAAFDRVRGALTRVNIEPPDAPWIVHAGTPDVAVAILPARQLAGDLETLVLGAIGAANRPLVDCVESFFDCLAARGHPSSPFVSKARMRATLAAFDPPDLLLGHAARKGLVPFDNPAFDPLVDLVPRP